MNQELEHPPVEVGVTEEFQHTPRNLAEIFFGKPVTVFETPESQTGEPNVALGPETAEPLSTEQLLTQAITTFEDHKAEFTTVNPRTGRLRLNQAGKEFSQQRFGSLLENLPEYTSLSSLKQSITSTEAGSVESRLFRQSLRGKADWDEKVAAFQVLEQQFPEDLYRPQEYADIGQLSGAARFSHELKLACQRAEKELEQEVGAATVISKFDAALEQEAAAAENRAEALTAETQPEPAPRGFFNRVRAGLNRVRDETKRQWQEFQENIREQGFTRAAAPYARRLGYAAITGITIGLALGGLGGLALALHQDIRRNQQLARDRSRPAIALGGVVPGIVTQPKTMERATVKHAVEPQVASIQRLPEPTKPTPITREQQSANATPTPDRQREATRDTPEPTPASLPVAGASEQKSSDLAAVPPPAVNILAEVEAPQPTYGQQVLKSLRENIADGAMLELPTAISHHNDACKGDNFCAPVQLVKPDSDGKLPDFFRDGVAGNSHIAPLYRLPQGDLVAYPHNLENHPEFLVLGVLSVNLESLEIGNTVKLAGYEFRIIAKDYVDPNAGFSAVTSLAWEYYGGRLFLFGCSNGGSLSADRVVLTAIPVEPQK